MDVSFEREISGNIKPYWGFYKSSNQIIGYKEETTISFNTITEVFTYLSNEDITSVIGNAYDITLSEETSDSFQINTPDGPLFAIYEDTYFNVTESNIFSAVDKWRYDKFDALALYGPISDWTLTDVYTMKDLFKDYTDFNEDISRWNTSTVTTMESMFQGTMFNQDIIHWDVSAVTSMSYMFQGNTSFNQPIGKWTTTQVTSMESMFDGATSFNQSLYHWNDISFVSNTEIVSFKNVSNMLNNTPSLIYQVLTGSVIQNTIYYAVDQYKTNRANYNFISNQWNNGIRIWF